MQTAVLKEYGNHFPLCFAQSKGAARQYTKNVGCTGEAIRTERGGRFKPPPCNFQTPLSLE